MTRLREDECYHLTNLIRDSLGEAEHLVRKAGSKAYSRTLDYDGSKGTAPLDPDEVRDISSKPATARRSPSTTCTGRPTP